MSTSPPSPVFPAPAGGANSSDAPFSARLVSNEMGSIRLGGSGRPVPIARRVLRTGNASSIENSLQASASPGAPIGRRLDPSTRISLDSTASDSSEIFRVRRIMPRHPSTSLGTVPAIQPISQPTRARVIQQTGPTSNPPLGDFDATDRRPGQPRIERASTRARMTSHTIPVNNKSSTGEDGRSGQFLSSSDIRNRTALTASSASIPAEKLGVSMVRKRNLPQKALSSTGGERKQPPVRTTSVNVDQLSALRMERGLSAHDETQATTQTSPTRDYSKLPPELLQHYTHHITHDAAQRPAASFVSRVDATGAQSPVAPWRLLDDRIDHIYEDPSIDMVQLNLFHPFAANDKERKLAERERLQQAASELRQRELEQKRQHDVVKERKDHIQQMSEAIRSRNRQAAKANRTQSPSPAVTVSAIAKRRGEDTVPKRKPPVPRLSGKPKQNKRRALRKSIPEAPASNSLHIRGTSNIASENESGDDAVQPSVTGSILLGDRAFGGMTHSDVTQSVLLQTDEEFSEHEVGKTALNQSVRSGRGKARVRKKNKQRKDNDAVIPRPETLQRRALAREFMILQKQSRQFEREKLKQQNEMEQEKRRRQMEELERRRLQNLRQTTRHKKRQLKKEEPNIPSEPQSDDVAANLWKSDAHDQTAKEDLQSDLVAISDTENDRGRANMTATTPSPSKSLTSSSSDVNEASERITEEDPAIVDVRLRKLLDLEEKAKSLMAKLHGLTKRKNSVKESDRITKRNATEKKFDIREPDIESVTQDYGVADSEEEEDEEIEASISDVNENYEFQDRADEDSEQESDSVEHNNDSDDNSEAATQLDIDQPGDYEFANRMSRLGAYESEARRFDVDFDPELDPRNIGVHRIGVVYPRDQLIEEEIRSEKSDDERRSRSSSVSSSFNSESDDSTKYQRKSWSPRNRTLEESVEQYMKHLCARDELSHHGSAGSHSSDGNSSSGQVQHAIAKERPIVYNEQLQVHHARENMNDDGLRQLFMQADDSLSVIHSAAVKLLTEKKEQRRLKMERERIEAEDIEALRQLEKDRQLESVMATILGQVESETELENCESDRNSEHLVMEDSSEAGHGSFITLEKIMEAVELERRQEREHEQRMAEEFDNSKHELYQKEKSVQDQHEVPTMFWNEMLSTGQPLPRKNPRVTIDTSELIMQRHQQEDEAFDTIDETPRLLHSPQSLAKRLLAEVELHDAIHDAHLQISKMEHSRAIEQVQRQTVLMASAFKEEMENNFSTHQVALQHATLEKKFDSDLQEVMLKLQEVHEAEEREKMMTSAETERALKQAQLREFGAQTDSLAQVDAATYAPLQTDKGTVTSVYVDACVQWDCSDDEIQSKTNPSASLDEYDQSASNAEAATAIGDDYDDEMFESEAEKGDDSKRSASSNEIVSSVEMAVDASEEEEVYEVTENDSIPYSEAQDSRSELPGGAVASLSHDEVEEIESQQSKEDADVQSDSNSIVSEAESAGSGDGVISSQNEAMHEIKSEHSEDHDDIESEHASVVSESQMDHESSSVKSEHDSNDKSDMMDYEDDFGESSPRMPLGISEEPEGSDVVDEETAIHDTESELKDNRGEEESGDYSDDYSSAHSPSKSESSSKNLNFVGANSRKQPTQPPMAVTSLLDRNILSSKIEESRPHIVVLEPTAAEAQSYMKDLEIRRQTEESLLQFRVHALEVRLQHELQQLENAAGSGTHWVNELMLRREALNMNFLAEKANVESLKAANMARYYQDLLAFQALTTYDLPGGTPTTFARPASFVTSPRMVLVTQPPSNLTPVTITTPSLVNIQPEEQSIQASDQYRDDEFASEDGNESASKYSFEDEQKEDGNRSIPSIESEHEEDASNMEEDIISENEKEENLSDDITSEKDEDEPATRDISITGNDEEEECINSEHDADEVEDVVRSDVDEIDEQEDAISDDAEEDDYAEDDFASASAADDLVESPSLAEEASEDLHENSIASADVETSIVDDGENQDVAENEDIQMELSHTTEIDASVTEAELPDETSKTDAEDYGDEIFESEASHSAVKSDQSKHSIASDDVASSVELDVGSKKEDQEDEVAEIDSVTHMNDISSLPDDDGGALSDHQELNEIESEQSQGETESDGAIDDNAGDIEEEDNAGEVSDSNIDGVEDAYEEEDFESASAIEGPIDSTVNEHEESECAYEDEFESPDLETRDAGDEADPTDSKTYEEDDYAAYSDEEFEAGSDIGSATELANEIEQVDAVAELPSENQNVLELHRSTDDAQCDELVMVSQDGANLLLTETTGEVELSQELSTAFAHNEKHEELSEVNANSNQAVSLSGSDSEEILTKSIENHLKRLKEIEQQILERRQEMKQIEKQKKVERRREDLCNKERALCEEMERVETQLRLEQANLELARHRNRLDVDHLAAKQHKLATKSWQPDFLSDFDYIEVVEVVEPEEHLSTGVQIPNTDSEPILQVAEQAELHDVIPDGSDVIKDEQISLDLLEDFPYIEDAESVNPDVFDMLPTAAIEDENIPCGINEHRSADVLDIVMDPTSVYAGEEEESNVIELPGTNESPIKARPSWSLSRSGDLLASFDYVEDVEEPIQNSVQDLLAHFDFVEEAELVESNLPCQDTEVGTAPLDHDSNFDDGIAESNYTCSPSAMTSNEIEPHAHLPDAVEEGFSSADEGEMDDGHNPGDEFCATNPTMSICDLVTRSSQLAFETEEKIITPANDHEVELRIEQVDRITELIYHDLLTTLDDGLRIVNKNVLLHPSELKETEMFTVEHQKQEVTAYRSDRSADADENRECEENLDHKHVDEGEVEEDSVPETDRQAVDTAKREAAYVRIADSLFRDMYEEILAGGMSARHQIQQQTKTDSRSTTLIQLQPTAIESANTTKRSIECARAIVEELYQAKDGRIRLPTRASISLHDTLAPVVYDIVAELLGDGLVNGSIENCRSYILQEIEALLMVQSRGQDDLEHQIRRVLSVEGETHGDDGSEEAEEAHITAQIRSNVSAAARTMERKLLLPTKDSELLRSRKTAVMTIVITQELEGLQERISNSIYEDLLTQM